jgi:hypothetical protein
MNVISLHIPSNHIQGGDNKNTNSIIFCRMHSTIKNNVELG